MTSNFYRKHHILIHGDVWDQVHTGKLTASEALLTGVIDLFSKPGGGGCWASKATLGKILGLKSRRIQYMISKLLRMEILIHLGYKRVGGTNLRVITTFWSYHPSFVRSREHCTAPGHSTAPNVFVRPPVGGPHKYVASSRDREEENMNLGVFQDLEHSTKEPDRWCLTCTNQLREALVKKHKITRAFSRKSWSKEFSILRKELSGDETRVEKVLDWFVQVKQDQYIPVVRSARSFRTKFINLEVAMNRENPPKIEVSKDARKVAGHYINLNWPKGSREQVEEVTEISIRNYERFRAQVKKLAAGNDTVHKFAKWALQAKMVPTDRFMYQWMVKVNMSVTNWKDWSGNLLHFVFQPHRKLVREEGRKWAAEYGVRPRIWDELLGLVGKQD